ncbi:putative Zn(2)-C6 fungal-type domain-containing protein [Seiridium cardinale]|uniref:Zn(2)-C6 fungal-type domain-containing protein n=1 Tax=Seiridium cardinale TaxID=138064 RepID=A0ABR2XPZ4_9PEZI
MNFAYYVTARVMQCTEFLDCLETSQSRMRISDACNSEPWIMVFLGVTAGIDWGHCKSLNAYTVDLSGLLLACDLHSSNLAIGLWAQAWAKQRYREGCLEEGSFPVFQILQILQIINLEWRAGGMSTQFRSLLIMVAARASLTLP